MFTICRRGQQQHARRDGLRKACKAAGWSTKRRGLESAAAGAALHCMALGFVRKLAVRAGKNWLGEVSVNPRDSCRAVASGRHAGIREERQRRTWDYGRDLFLFFLFVFF